MNVFEKADDVQPITIIIAGQVPVPLAPNNGSIDDYLALFYADYYQRAGGHLADLLVQHLPGGTLDQLLVALLMHKASMLRVRYVARTENEK